MTDNTDMLFPSPPALAGASACPSCGEVGEFDLPAAEGNFEIACYECDHIYEISAKEAIDSAAMRDLADAPAPRADGEPSAYDEQDTTTIHCMDCGSAIAVTGLDADRDDFNPKCPSCAPDPADLSDDVDTLLATTRFAGGQIAPAPATSRTGIILVSIFSFGLILSAGAIALGLYFLTLRADSDVARYIETNVLQLAPASFSVRTATYEISETDLGKSLLVTIAVTNTGQVEGAPEDLKITLTDASDNALVTWPLDATNQIIAPGETTKLYTRLFEPPADFANLRVFMR